MDFSVLGRGAICALLVVIASPAHADRMALWTIVHDQCVPHLSAGEAPKPCDEVDLSAGVAYLKDLNGVAQMLAIPTNRVTGIEDPALLAPDAPNYFATAWNARRDVEAHLGRPLAREAVAITINSMFSRSQDQLHLHVDCLDKSVAAALAEDQASIDAKWLVMTTALNGRRYWARRADSAGLADISPFKSIADEIPGAREEMGLWSLAAVGASFAGKPGFILLADHAELTAGGHAEDIQDHACAIAGPKS